MGKEPWIPAPGKTSLRSKHSKWNNCLQPSAASTSRQKKRVEEEEEENMKLRERLEEYEDKIETLIAQTDLNKSELEVEEQKLEMEALKSERDDKDLKLLQIVKERNESEIENEKLRHNISSMLHSNHDPRDADSSILRHLVETEVNGIEISKLLSNYRDVIRRLRADGDELRLAMDLEILDKTKQLLMEKMDDYDVTNRQLRHMLQSQYKKHSGLQRAEDDRNSYRDQLTSVEATMIRMRTDLEEKNVYVDRLLQQLDEEKKNSRSMVELNKAIETTRAHLQRELRSRDMENCRLHIQLKKLEDSSSGVQDIAKEETRKAKYEREKLKEEKEQVKKAARISRNRVEKIEEKLCSVRCKVEEKEMKLQKSLAECELYRNKHKTETEDRLRIESQYQLQTEEKMKLDNLYDETCKKLKDVQVTQLAAQKINKNNLSELNHKLQKLTSENDRLREEGDNRQVDEHEKEEMRNELRRKKIENQNLEDDLIKTKLGFDQATRTAERAERSSQRMRDEGSDEIDRVRHEMLQRIKQLQPLPQILKETEMKLQDAEDKLHIYQQKYEDQHSLIDELTNKAEDRLDESQVAQLKLSSIHDEKRALDAKVEILMERLNDKQDRMQRSESEMNDKHQQLTQLEMKLSQLKQERDSYKRQLDNAFNEFRSSIENEKDKSTTRENTLQSKLINLESDLTRTKAEYLEIKRAKEDSERRLQSRLQDTRDQLEQSESTVTSMRSYVDFLKTSYNNVFGGTN